MHWSAVLLSVVLGLAGGQASERIAVLIVGHGSPSAKWNGKFLDFSDAVRSELGPRYEARPAFLEMARPSVADAAAGLCRGGRPLMVLPCFVFPTEHSEEDLPALLGVRYLPWVERRLAAEGAKTVHLRGPVALLPTMSGWGTALGEVLAERALQASRRPSQEAVVVLVHGSQQYESLIEQAFKRSVVGPLRRAGFAHISRVCVGMGELLARMMPLAEQGHSPAALRARLTAALEEAGKRARAVIVVAAYVATTPDDLFGNWPAAAGGAEVRVVHRALLFSRTLVEAAARTIRQAARWQGWPVGQAGGAITPQAATAGAGGRGR